MPETLNSLRQRKEALLVESELNRRVLAIEMAQLKVKAGEWRAAMHDASRWSSWIAPLAGAAAGLMAGRKRRPDDDPERRTAGGFLEELAPLAGTVLSAAMRHLVRRLRKREGG
jgi:hypothetical protein